MAVPLAHGPVRTDMGSMARRLILAASAVALLASAAAAQPAPARGAVVRDPHGEVLGRVETVVTDSTGRPVQVIIRSRTIPGVRSTLRALPAASLRPNGDGLRTPLRKAEFEVLPPVRR